ncbi:MAG TPA: XRE family transcriptional regulator [Planctomycetota bacterium]|nr:XRE family transcriptional regulator [Planctomycetota bacterium]HUW30491.1 XRE family transcriptional regulator [Planctomycetota bacterium]
MSGASERFRDFREQQRLSQAELAERLGVPQKHISDVERGRTSFREDFLLRVHERLGLSIDWLLTGKGSRHFRPDERVDPDEVVGVLQQLRGMMETGALARVAEDTTHYGGLAVRRVGLFEIEGQTEIPFTASGLPGPAERLATCPDDLTDPDAFACRLAGNSMVPEFRPGTVLFFMPAAQVNSGDYVFARLDDRATFRQAFLDDNLVRLVPVNRNFPEIRLPRDKVRGMFRLAWAMARF